MAATRMVKIVRTVLAVQIINKVYRQVPVRLMWRTNFSMIKNVVMGIFVDLAMATAEDVRKDALFDDMRSLFAEGRRSA